MTKNICIFPRDTSQTKNKIKCSLNNKGIAFWEEPKIVCKAQECQDPGIPLNGFRSGDNLQFPHTIEFSCAPGFNLIGSAQRMCTSVGEWSGEQPLCKRKKIFNLTLL
ncbi:unnamed protein product [Meloidogyne enterolobii]|uniref:Uncharacterized protein n=2 Tax=Meloidogyne enterolobii TaxID=390850 RepID=A0ACB1B9P0_MELEN